MGYRLHYRNPPLQRLLRALTSVSSRRFLAVLALAMGLVLVPTMALNFVVDPYEMNGLFDLGIDKRRIAYPRQYKLYKLIAYRRNPQPNVILGDSRSEELPEESFARSGARYFNLSFPGGTLRDEIDTFWWLTRSWRIRSAVFGVPFNLFSDGNRAYAAEQMALLSSAIELASNPVAYYQNAFVRDVSWLGVRSLYAPAPDQGWTARQAGNIPQIRWNEILTWADAPYRTWAPPRILLAELDKIRAYCTSHGIALAFFIPPSHVDLQNKVAQFELAAQYRAYKEELARLGPVFDYDVDSELTRDRENYRDPFHVTARVADWLVHDMLERGLPK